MRYCDQLQYPVSYPFFYNIPTLLSFLNFLFFVFYFIACTERPRITPEERESRGQGAKGTTFHNQEVVVFSQKHKRFSR